MADRDILKDFPLAESEEDLKQTSDLVQDFKRFREAPIESIKTFLKHVTGTSWRSYDNYIGQQLYTPGLTEFFKQQTLANPALQERINQLANRQLELEFSLPADLDSLSPRAKKKILTARDERLTELKGWLLDMADRMVDEMTSSFDHKSVLRGLYYIVGQIFSRTYHQGVHVDMNQIAELRAKALELQQKKQSILFMPCHKSHIDYMSIHFICFRAGIAVPSVIAGDNLNFAVIGPIIRQAGALWIRRSFGNDKLYSATMQAFVEMLLSNGYNFECFIEGTRSRTGKLLPPKFGILKFILEAILSGRVEDSWVVPVSTQYDKVAEAESYATELLGKEKQKENFSGFLSARKIMTLQMGRVDVRFHKAWSLREFLTNSISKELTKSALRSERGILINLAPDAPPEALAALNKSGHILTQELKTRVLRSLGYKILADINDVSVVMPTSLIGTMLLTNRGRGMSKENLQRRVRWLMAQVKHHGGNLGDFARTASIEKIVDNGLDVLGKDLVGEEEAGLLQTTYFAKDPFKLSYYRNQIIHLFVTEAIVTVAMYSRVMNIPNSEDFITYGDLLGRVTFLSRLLSGEFVFGPEGIQTNLWHTLQSLAKQDVLVLDTVDENNKEKNVGGLDILLASKDADDHHDTIIKISPREVARGRENFDFYCFFVWPFVDGFWLTLVALFSLTPLPQQAKKYYDDKLKAGIIVPPGPAAKGDLPLLWVDEKSFLSAAQALGKTLYHQGIITYYEAVNKEMLKNSLMQYVAEGIVLHRTEEGKPNMIALHPSWLPERLTDDTVFRENNNTNPAAFQISRDTTTGQTKFRYFDVNDDPDMIHVLHRGDIIPQGKLYDFEESVSHTRRLLRLRRDSPALTVPVLRLVSNLLVKSPSRQEMLAMELEQLEKQPHIIQQVSELRRELKDLTEKTTKQVQRNIEATTEAAGMMRNAPPNGGRKKKKNTEWNGVPEVVLIQSLNDALKPVTEDAVVTVSRPSKVAFTSKI